MLINLFKHLKYLKKYELIITNYSLLYKCQNTVIKETQNEYEIELLKKLNHPQIIGILDSYNYNNKYNQVMKFSPDGDLYENILQK